MIILISAISGSLSAQSTSSGNPSRTTAKSEKEQRKLKRIKVFKEQEEGENVFQRDFSLGGRLNTDGWSGFFELGYRKSRKVVNYFQFEFSEKKSLKEYKQQGYAPTDMGIASRPYVYGKQNNFYPVKLGIGQRYLIGGKANKNGVEVSAIYYGGISIGLLKPYYLSVNVGNDQIKEIKYDPNGPYKDAFLDQYAVTGGGGFGKGWSEVSVVPGLHAKLGMRFDWAHFNEVVSALECGVNAEMYTKKIPIMINEGNKQFIFNAYVGLQFGKRWNKR
ncbi:hypothetical protein CLV59_103318 [Chitinophaga dinghuensis]|uniref:Outer membrane protein with beta-barrel domain n=1 Tax=Chitinophaga dinghuensis TaxID=1539050 RepID=A0A327W206_9BACT|nr:hypothetical protein CLV59_103318 [Chitinophaga dinghuensis]